MPDAWDIYGSQTDKWGFTRYSLAIHSPATFAERVMAFRKAAGFANLTSEPHVSITSSLYQPADLNELQRKLAQAIASAEGFRLSLEAEPVEHRERSGWLAVVPSAPLQTLRETLKNAVANLIRSGGDLSRPYQPHVTLYQGADADEAARARNVAGTFDFGDGFDAASVELVGRVGPPRGGTRKIIASYAFGHA